MLTANDSIFYRVMVMNSEKLLVGLTGGIACGKSVALEFFRELGWKTISTDEIVADLFQKDESVRQSVKTKWGQRVFQRDEIDKSKIAEIIFNNLEEKNWLENLLHPLVRDVWMNAAKFSEEKKVVVEIPLLFEKKLEHLFQITVCVQCEKKIQLQRLFDRGLTKAQSNARIATQMILSEKIRLADIVLFGGHSLLFLKQQIEYFHANNA